MDDKMGKYLLSFFYVILLYFFWVGLISELLGLKPPAGVFSFVVGLFLTYLIANIAMKKGYSWWKHFLLFGFFSTGIPIVGIIRAF